MPKRKKPRIRKKAGLPPGSLVYTGKQQIDEVRFSLIKYDGDYFEELHPANIEDCLQKVDPAVKNWINVDGIHDVKIVERIGSQFKLHPLLLEDILNPDQRPKIDLYEEERHYYLVVKMLFHDSELKELEAEQVSIVVGENVIISFQEKSGDVFDPVRERLRAGRGRIRMRGTDYLSYALVDAVVDNYYFILEQYGERIEQIEDRIIEREQDDQLLNQLHDSRRDLIFLRKSVWPLREVISRMEKGGIDLIHSSTTVFIRDLYDHTIRVMDSIETFRDMLSSLHDMHMTNMSNKMNEIMKVLTIIATIFIPLTFIAGVYGMNFRNMPELDTEYGYFITWGVMLLIGVGLVMYFKRKGWF